jgi:glyoxylase-like metal-dependent hydrolase (beta-lactamase superfamily II)
MLAVARPGALPNQLGERQMFKEGDLRRRELIRLAALGVAAAQFGVMGTARAQSDQSTPDEAGEITAAAAPSLPDYAPVPQSALGPALNDRGYFVGRVERNLYWVTDGTYQAAFLTTREGVVLFDAPASIGSNLQRAIDQIAAANGVSSKVTHLVYSHHHADHTAASSLFGNDVVRIGNAETRRLLLRDDDPRRPPPDETFTDHRKLEIGGERIQLAWHGSNHTSDNSFIHFPDHDTLMLVDIVNAGWVPIYSLNLAVDVPGYIEAPATALSYPWTHLISGHMGRLGTRDDLTLQQQYVADLSAGARAALGTVDPTPFFVKYGNNSWAAIKGYLDAVADAAAAPVIQKYTGVLAAADVFTASTALWVLESIRLDLGVGIPVRA